MGSSSEYVLYDQILEFLNDDEVTLFKEDSTHHSSSTPIHTTNGLCVPCDELADLKCLSTLEEESLHNEDLQKKPFIAGIKASNDDVASKNHEFQPQPNNPSSPTFNPQVLAPSKARSKRTRRPRCNWTSIVLPLSPTMSSPVPWPDDHVISPLKPTLTKRDSYDNRGKDRKCFHCAADKTPQWRSGPMGPKTLCNACGVRYKSGRLMPEYRPAASPTFTATKHSNSHRKVMELRRQKEMSQAQHQPIIHLHQQNMRMIYGVSSNPNEYFHPLLGPHFT